MKRPRQSQSLRERAYRAMRRLLVLQRIPEGERLREPQWARQLGVNRTALREAFARLEAEGLIVLGERTGYRVPVLSEKDMQEIVLARVMLECAAIEQVCAVPAAAKRTSKGLLRLCDQFERFAKSKYFLGASEADRRFHELLIDSAANKRLAMLYHRAPLPLIHGHVQTEEQWSEQCRITAAEHRAIAQAIGLADARRAKAALKAHLRLRYLLAISA